MLPEAFEGARNVVMLAFKQRHQTSVDSWVPWLETLKESDPGFSFYEIPAIGRVWSPFRSLIDGGMAAAIREPVVLRRTLTFYGDVSLITTPLGITNRDTIHVIAVDNQFHVRGMVRGAFCESNVREILRAI